MRLRVTLTLWNINLKIDIRASYGKSLSRLVEQLNRIMLYCIYTEYTTAIGGNCSFHVVRIFLTQWTRHAFKCRNVMCPWQR